MDPDDLFAELEKQFDDPDDDGAGTATLDVIDFKSLSNLDLSTRFNDIRDELLERGEMMNPTTDRGRELHSMRAAALIEMSNRGMR